STFSGMSEEKAWRRRSCGVRTCRGAGSSVGTTDSNDGWGTERRRGARSGAGVSSGAAGATGSATGALALGLVGFLAGFWSAGAVSSAVLRNRSASGPSRMLARLPVAICEDLLGELPIGVCGQTVGIVLQHGHAFHRGFGKTNRFADSGGEDLISEVLLEQLDRLLGVQRAQVDERGQDALDLD